MITGCQITRHSPFSRRGQTAKGACFPPSHSLPGAQADSVVSDRGGGVPSVQPSGWQLRMLATGKMAHGCTMGPTPTTKGLLFESTGWLIIFQDIDELQTTEESNQDLPKPGMPHSQAWARQQKMALDCKLPTRRDGMQKDWSINDLLKDRSYHFEHVIMVTLQVSCMNV